MPYRKWTSGQLVTSADFQSYIQDQTAALFASAAARAAAIPSPTEGLLSYLSDVRRFEVWTGGAWFPVAGRMPSVGVLWGGGSIPSGTNRISSAPTASSPVGGPTVDGQGLVTINPGGLWHVSGRIAVTGTNYIIAAYLGTNAAANLVQGARSAINVSSALTVEVNGLVNLAAGYKLALWSDASTALTANGAQLDAVYIGPS